MFKKKFLGIIILAAILILLGFGSGVLGLRTDILKSNEFSNLKTFFGKQKLEVGELKMSQGGQMKVVTEESVTIDIVKKVTPAVVTVGITKNQPVFSQPDFGFGPFGFFDMPMQQGSKQIKQDIGSGFIVKSDGLIITNKHVVADTTAKYRVITADNKSFDVVKINRDPVNDLAILKINPSAGSGQAPSAGSGQAPSAGSGQAPSAGSGQAPSAGSGQTLPTVELGDSSKLQVGQFALAIGTALGEFRSTVTTGVVSGLGRGITAGSPLEGSEKLSGVIQTSAAINPGNSGGPLLNSSGQVIGVNVAVASEAQNIGFALPINLVKDSLANFENQGGSFAKKAFLGVEYQMVTRDLAILNEIPEGAYIKTVVGDSPAEKAGVEQGDIITKIDGKMLRESEGGLAAVIASKKPGQTVELTIYKGDNKTVTGKATLTEAQQ